MAHGIFRGDNVTSITDPAKIRTIQVYADIDNGAPITLGALAASGKYAGEAEVFTTATANGAAAANVWVVTTPEIDYTNYALEDFFNANGAIGRAIAMEKYDIFSVTSEVLSAIPTGTDKYIAAGNGAWTVSSASTKAFAQYLGSDVQDGVTFYAYQVL
jgi:hypothetical protein